MKPGSAFDLCLFRPTTNTYSYDNSCGRQRALDLCSGRQRTYFHRYVCGRPTTSTRSGRLRSLGGGSLVRAGLTSPAGWNLLPPGVGCCVGLRVCSGSPLSLPSKIAKKTKKTFPLAIFENHWFSAGLPMFLCLIKFYKNS